MSTTAPRSNTGTKVKYFDPITRAPCAKREYLKVCKAIASAVGKRLAIEVFGYDELGNDIGVRGRGLVLPFWIIKKLHEAFAEQRPAKNTFDTVTTVSKVGTGAVRDVPADRVAALWEYANKRLRDCELESLAEWRSVSLVRHVGDMPYYKVVWESPRGSRLLLQGLRGPECGFRDFIDTGFHVEEIR